MNEKQIRQMSVLALCLALQDIAPPRKGRHENLYKRLQKEATKALKRLPRCWPKDVAKSHRLITEWQEATGWTGNARKHVMTYVNFLLDAIEREGVKAEGVVRCLELITDHYERAGNVPRPTFWAGALAAEKWSATRVACY